MEMLLTAAFFAFSAGALLFGAAVARLLDTRRFSRMRDLAFARGDAGAPVDGTGLVERMRDGSKKTGFIGVFAHRRQASARRLEMQRHIPEMIDAVALGMRAGLSFEAAFGLYCSRFDDCLARACRRACSSWESGLVPRDAALRVLSEDVDDPVMTRFVGNVVRCLRFGSSMSRVFDVMANEARSCYRSRMEEAVAKAPVKMLIPTAGLILPAMLIVVMGPVLLEFL